MRRGFTLLELMVVLVIVALGAAAAVMSWTGVYRQASLEGTIARLESLDQHLPAPKNPCCVKPRFGWGLPQMSCFVERYFL